jgi:colanic acid biosynthesis glycosyl transferase WcaI
MVNARESSLLVISQVYVPDPASVGQHLADAAEALAGRGHGIRVLTSSRGYENPRQKYPRRDNRAGAEIVRLPLSSFGKRNLGLRLLGQMMFLLQVIVRGLIMRRLAGILVSTSPPMAAFAAMVIAMVRRVPITYWLMDLNPDQAVALGKVSQRSRLVWAMKWLNRRIFSRAAAVVVLDRFMAERVRRQYEVCGELAVLPPWPHVDDFAEVPIEQNPFVAKHHLRGRFVVMYSGNHSLASPVTTLVEAALALRDDPRFLFLFVGGGLGKRDVEQAIETHRPQNIVSLPYQPLEKIKYSLSAANLHVVTLGDQMAGIIHPCKVYGAMAVGRPILLVGPRPSHVTDLIDQYEVGWQVDHGDVTGMVARLRAIAEVPPAQLNEMGERARRAMQGHHRKEHLCGAFCDVVERNMNVGDAYKASTSRQALERLEPVVSDAP